PMNRRRSKGCRSRARVMPSRAQPGFAPSWGSTVRMSWLGFVSLRMCNDTQPGALSPKRSCWKLYQRALSGSRLHGESAFLMIVHVSFCCSEGPMNRRRSKSCRSCARVMPSRAQRGFAPSWTSKTGRSWLSSASLRMCDRSQPGASSPERSCWKLYHRVLSGSRLHGEVAFLRPMNRRRTKSCRSCARVMPSRAQRGFAPSWTSKTGRSWLSSASLRMCDRSQPGASSPERSCWKLYHRALSGSRLHGEVAFLRPMNVRRSKSCRSCARVMPSRAQRGSAASCGSTVRMSWLSSVSLRMCNDTQPGALSPKRSCWKLYHRALSGPMNRRRSKSCRSCARVMPSRAQRGFAPSWTSKTGRSWLSSASLRMCDRSQPGASSPERSCWKLYHRALSGSRLHGEVAFL
ncbi:unnamed protein product, partial [Symbiodinium sp. CCMP2592]